MEESEMDKRINWDQVAELAEKIREQGLSLVEGAKMFGIPVWRLYELSRRKEDTGKGDSENNSPDSTEGASKGKGENGGDDPFSHSSLPLEIQQLIIEYRNGESGVGFKSIEDRLKSDHLVVVNRKQIRQVLKNHGLLEEHDSSFDRPGEGKGSRRFEAAFAGEMYQMDVSYVYLSGLPVQYLVVIVDDYSRFCVCAELVGDQKGETLLGLLHEACNRHGKPGKLLTDQGSGFYSWSARQTMFQQYLDDQRIEHLVGNRHSPQSQGKVERLIQTLKKEWLGRTRFSDLAEAVSALSTYTRRYNYDRPHQGIDGARPADRFYGVVAERSRIEADLAGKEIDFSKGYCIFKIQENSVSVVNSPSGIAVYLNGKLLEEVGDDHDNRGTEAV
jgi:transposase InsO family protein